VSQDSGLVQHLLPNIGNGLSLNGNFIALITFPITGRALLGSDQIGSVICTAVKIATQKTIKFTDKPA
jgi:hypothetical protein